MKNEEKEEKILKWYYYVVLLFVYIGYLAVGAAVFYFFEKPHEVAKCNESKEGIFFKKKYQIICKIRLSQRLPPRMIYS